MVQIQLTPYAQMRTCQDFNKGPVTFLDNTFVTITSCYVLSFKFLRLFE